MKIWSFIALRTALVLMLLHNMVPHQHHHEQEQHCVEQSGEKALLLWLGDLFHADLGQEHLEEFSARGQHFSPAPFLEKALDLCAFHLEFFSEPQEEQFFPFNSLLPQRQLIYSRQLLRGPPVLLV